MLKRYQRVVGGAFRIVDVCVVAAAWALACFTRVHLPIFQKPEGPFVPFAEYASVIPIIMTLWAVVFSNMRVYQSQRMLRRTHEAHLIVRAHGVAMLFFLALSYLFTDAQFRYSRVIMIYFGVIGALLLVVFRLTLRNALRHFRRKGFNLRHVLAVGEGPSLEMLMARMERFPELGLRVIGALSHEDSKATAMGGKPILGHYAEIHSVMQSSQPPIDQVLIALPRQHYKELDGILSAIRDETVDIRLVPDIHEYVTLGCEVEDFDGLPIVNLNDSPLEGWGAIAKRMTDILLSGAALILLSPILLLLMLLIRVTSRGPIFYHQERMGLDGRTFKMYKFRTMVADAEKDSGAVWAAQKDSRRTLLGSFLRSTSLDELPQLWNVLKGEMSLVGPRPERPVFVRQFKTEIPHYMLRHKVKAGMTGWAQVNGWRGNTSLDRRIEFDLYYIRNWSYLLDLKIMMLTLWRGFINRNAY